MTKFLSIALHITTFPFSINNNVAKHSTAPKKNRKLEILFAILGLLASFPSFSQVNRSALGQIFASSCFTLDETYFGDWGDSHTVCKFIKKRDIYHVHFYTKSNQTKRQSKIKKVVSANAVDSLKNIFLNCMSNIEDSKNRSTEHIIYTFESKKHTCIVDDHFTHVCADDLKVWKEVFFLNAR